MEICPPAALLRKQTVIAFKQYPKLVPVCPPTSSKNVSVLASNLTSEMDESYGKVVAAGELMAENPGEDEQ